MFNHFSYDHVDSFLCKILALNFVPLVFRNRVLRVLVQSFDFVIG